MNVVIVNNTSFDLTEVENKIKELLQIINDLNCFSVVFITKDEIHRMNKLYRNKDYATDVLSFATDGEIEGDLGDIFISPEKAIEQATEYGHSFLREMLFLTVHGYLHLNGYDHETPEEEKVMMAKTEELLKLINLERKN